MPHNQAAFLLNTRAATPQASHPHRPRAGRGRSVGGVGSDGVVQGAGARDTVTYSRHRCGCKVAYMRRPFYPLRTALHCSIVQESNSSKGPNTSRDLGSIPQYCQDMQFAHQEHTMRIGNHVSQCSSFSCVSLDYSFLLITPSLT